MEVQGGGKAQGVPDQKSPSLGHLRMLTCDEDGSAVVPEPLAPVPGHSQKDVAVAYVEGVGELGSIL
jgi:hypothetical protein